MFRFRIKKTRLGEISGELKYLIHVSWDIFGKKIAETV